MLQKTRDRVVTPSITVPATGEQPVYTFEVRSLQEGLEQIKQQLGEHAMILSTKRLPNGMLEIVVAQGNKPADTLATAKAVANTSQSQGPTRAVHQTPQQTQEIRKSGPSPAVSAINDQLKQLQSEVRQLRLEYALKQSHDEVRLGPSTWDRGMKNLKRSWPSGLIEALGQVRQQMLDVGVEHAEVDALTVAAISTAEDVEDNPALVWKLLEQIMVRCLKVAVAPWDIPFKDDRPQLHVLVGSSGVGKTTLAAKIAAHARYVAELPTTLLAADAYRIGGLYQLRAYGELIEVPVVSATGPDQIRRAVQVSEPRSMIVVDTCGSWSSQEAEPPSFWATLHEVADVYTHLVFSVTASPGQVMHQLSTLNVARPSSVVLTHGDELWAPGPVLSMLYRMNLPVSLISSGRQVPEALEAFHPEGLVKSILELG